MQGRKPPIAYRLRCANLGVEGWVRQSLWYLLGVRISDLILEAQASGNCVSESDPIIAYEGLT